jgi:hypothetical protein
MGVSTAILITTSVCNLKYCVHANIGAVSMCKMYTFGNICLWSMFMESLVCKIQRLQTTQENVLVDSTALSTHVNYFAELASLGVNNFHTQNRHRIPQNQQHLSYGYINLRKIYKLLLSCLVHVAIYRLTSSNPSHR